MNIQDKHIPGTNFTSLITFHTYGTWLHGDQRGSVDRYTSRYGQRRLPPNDRRFASSRTRLKRAPVRLYADQRRATQRAIRETCAFRNWKLYAENVRTNHVHVVVVAPEHPKRVAATLKANATRIMRETGCWSSRESPWSHGCSAVRIWNEVELERAVRYVVDRQGIPLDDGE